MFKLGLIVGKFCPLHKGHEYVISTALSQCEKVVILSYTSLPNAPTSPHRRLWLTTLFPTAIVVVPEQGFPNDNDAEIVHRLYCKNTLAKLDMYPDAVFGSETYISGFAKVLGATPVTIDIDRKEFPISGTELRNNHKLMEKWTSPIVQRSLAKTILLIGGESSGKTTLAKELQRVLPMSGIVLEYGRIFGETTNNTYTYKDMLHIAKTQVELEESEMMYASGKYIICDTSPLVTKFYSQKWYNTVDPMLDILAQRTYDHVYFCKRDFPFVDDGTRNGVEFSNEQAQYYCSNIPQGFTTIYGSVENRIQNILTDLNKSKYC